VPPGGNPGDHQRGHRQRQIDIVTGIVAATGLVVASGSSSTRFLVPVATVATGTLAGTFDPVWWEVGANALTDINAFFGNGASNPTLSFTETNSTHNSGVTKVTRFGEGLSVPSGCAIVMRATLSGTSGVTVEADFVPWVSGMTRKRLALNPQKLAI
jgi:hypothetical protein